MIACPNRNSTQWKDLSEAIGEAAAKVAFHRLNTGAIPTAEIARKLLDRSGPNKFLNENAAAFAKAATGIADTAKEIKFSDPQRDAKWTEYNNKILVARDAFAADPAGYLAKAGKDFAGVRTLWAQHQQREALAKQPQGATQLQLPLVMDTALKGKDGYSVGKGSFEAHMNIPGDAKEENRGFVVRDPDGTERFADRTEAAKIAVDAGQVPGDVTSLHSEHIREPTGYESEKLWEIERFFNPRGGGDEVFRKIRDEGRVVEMQTKHTYAVARALEGAVGIRSTSHERQFGKKPSEKEALRFLEVVGALQDNPKAKVMPDTGEPIKPLVDAWDATAKEKGRITTAKALEQATAEFARRHSEINKHVEQLGLDQYLDYVDNYMEHEYLHETPQDQEALRRMKMETNEKIRQTHQRVFPTFQEAKDVYNLRPAHLNIADNLRFYAESVWRNTASKVVATTAALMRNVDDTPVFMPEFRVGEKDEGGYPKDYGQEGYIHDGAVQQMTYQLADRMNDEGRNTELGRLQGEINRRQNDILKARGDVPKINRLTAEINDLRTQQADPKFPRQEVNLHHAEGIRGAYNELVQAYGPKRRGYKDIVSTIPSFGHVWAHPDSVNYVKMFNDKPFEGFGMKGFQELNQWSKYLSLNLSLFHPASLLESYLAAFGAKEAAKQSANPYKTFTTLRDAVRDIRAGKYDMDAWRMGGMKTSENPDIQMDVVAKRIEQWSKGLRAHGHGYLADGLNRWGRANVAWNSWLWNSVQPAMKILTAERMLMEMKQNLKERGAPINERALREDIAGMTNQMFGGQEWSTYKWATPRALQAMHLGVFAPDWTSSALNVSGLTSIAPFNKLMDYNMSPAQLAYTTKKYWPGQMVMVLGVPAFMQAAAYMAAGDPDKGDKMLPYQNDPGKQTSIDMTPILRHLGWVPGIGYEGGDSGQRRVYLRWGKQAWEVLDGWLTDPRDTFLNKTSSGVRLAYEQITNTNTAGWKMPWADNPGILGGLFSANGSVWDGRLASAAEKAVPMSVLSVLEGRPSSFFAPSSRGTSIGTTTTQLAHVLSAYADPGVWRTISERKMEPDLKALAGDILTAADRNGVDSNAALNRARVQVLAKYYNNFFKALDKKHDAGMQQAAESIVRLHGSLQGMMQSMNRRRKNLRRPWTSEEAMKAEAQFKAGQQTVE